MGVSVTLKSITSEVSYVTGKALSGGLYCIRTGLVKRGTTYDFLFPLKMCEENTLKLECFPLEVTYFLSKRLSKIYIYLIDGCESFRLFWKKKTHVIAELHTTSIHIWGIKKTLSYTLRNIFFSFTLAITGYDVEFWLF